MFLLTKQSGRIIIVLMLAYSLLYLTWYWSTPFGSMPVLDGMENVKLAHQIAENKLPKEPFYRAMLYPLLLSPFAALGLDNREMMMAAGLLSMIFHLLSSLILASTANKLWENETAGIMAAVLYGFYPLAIYFAADPLDITIAVFFLCLSFYTYLLERSTNNTYFGILAGISLGIGSLVRANILPLAGLWVIDLLFKKSRKSAVVSLFALLLIMLCGGLINLWQGKEYRLLPWQGSYALYSANHEESNGKYYNQTIMVTDRPLGSNPSRFESEVIYYRATNTKPPLKVDEFNRFWNQKTFNHITKYPQKWLGLMCRKVYYLFNNFEQYNNKTYSFHRQLTPLLYLNPICWGVLLILAVLTIYNVPLLFDNLRQLLLALFLLSAGIIAFYVSARFRLLLVPSLVLLACGIFTGNNELRIKWKMNILIAISIGFLTFSGFFNVADTSTFIADKMLLAHANIRLRNYSETMKLAQQVLKKQPLRIDALRIKIAAFVNMALNGEIYKDKDWKMINEDINWLLEKKLMFPETAFISGCYVYRFKNDPEYAKKIWLEGKKEYSKENIYISKSEPTSEISSDIADINTTNVSSSLGISEYEDLFSWAIAITTPDKAHTNTQASEEVKRRNHFLYGHL